MSTPSQIEQDHKTIHIKVSATFGSKLSKVMLELRIKASSYIGKGHEVMPKLCMNTLSYIKQGYKVMPKLYINTSCYIKSGNKFIPKLHIHGHSQLHQARLQNYIRVTHIQILPVVLSKTSKAMKLYQNYICIGTSSYFRQGHQFIPELYIYRYFQ